MKGEATDRLYLRPPRHISTLPVVVEMESCLVFMDFIVLQKHGAKRHD
jgi:hypothetical protein